MVYPFYSACIKCNHRIRISAAEYRRVNIQYVFSMQTIQKHSNLNSLDINIASMEIKPAPCLVNVALTCD